MALLMALPPACPLSCMTGPALGPPALFMAVARGACPSQWGTASPAAAIKAKPATVTAAQAGLCRSAAVISDRLRCRAWGPTRARVLVRAEDRDGLLCRAGTRDTSGPSM